MQSIELAAAPYKYQSREVSAYERTAAEVAQTYQLMEDFNLRDILKPLVDYFPDTTEPLQALHNIRREYGWPIEDVASVIIDVANKSQPIFVTEKQFNSLDEVKGLQVGTFRGKFNDQAGIARFGSETEMTRIDDRLLPDGWNNSSHSSEEWLRRAEIAEDITIYFARGAQQLLNQRSPANLFDAAELLKPFDEYGRDCTTVASLIQEKDLFLADQRAEAETFSDSLKGSVGFAQLAPDEVAIDHDQWQHDQHSVDRQVTQAWRDHSDFSTSPEEQRRLKAEYEAERRQLNAMAQLLKREIRYELNQRLRTSS